MESQIGNSGEFLILLIMFLLLSITGRAQVNNDNNERKLIFSVAQQQDLTIQLTQICNQKLTDEKTGEWNGKLSEGIGDEWNSILTDKPLVNLSDKLSTLIASIVEENLTGKLTDKWKFIPDDQFADYSQYYLQ